MRLELKFMLKERHITINDRACVMSFLKFALSKKYPLIFQSLYGENCSKAFCFSTYLPNPKYVGDRYLLSDNCISVKISSSDKQLLIALYNSLMGARFSEFALPQSNSFKLVGVSYSNTQKVKADRVLIKFLSPLVVREHNKETNADRYLDYTDADFMEKLQIITGNYLTDRGFGNCIVELYPIKASRTVARSVSNLKINCSYGLFELRASPHVIEELYLSGIGSRRNQGFGMFDLVNQQEV